MPGANSLRAWSTVIRKAREEPPLWTVAQSGSGRSATPQNWVICAARGTVAEHMVGLGAAHRAVVGGLGVPRLGAPLELSGSFRPCDGGDCPLAFVQIDRLSKSTLGRTATAEQAQHVREPEAGIGLQCQ
jgi:hypothetical protein